MVKAKFWTVVKLYDGAPKDSDFKLEEEELPAVGDGQFLVEAEAWSVDPYMRAYVGSTLAQGAMKLPFRQFGFQVGKVLESKNPSFPVGAHVVSHNGWCSHSVLSEAGPVGFEIFMGAPPYRVAPALASLPISYMVGVLGMPGMTAYFGVEDILKPKSGETMLVTGAAGAVGSVVGQLGKIAGCTVIGYAGSDEKVAWLKEMGFDHAFNYKTTDVDETLKVAAPKGIDTFFDNVGGDFANRAYHHLAMDSRVCQCGAISGYNDKELAKIPDFRGLFIGKRAALVGLHVSKYTKEFPKGIATVAGYLGAGKMQARETKYTGLNNIPQAFMEMLKGANLGKAVVQA